MGADLSGYRGRRVLVTGSTGFKGSWLCAWLHRLGADVVGLALECDEHDANFHRIGLDERIDQRIQDIRDFDGVDRIVNSVRPEYVFHLAAQALVRQSYANPSETYETNIIGSVRLLDAVRNCTETRSVVFVTSDKCYRNRETGEAYCETDELGGHDPYSASKACAEIVAQSYYESFLREKGSPGLATVRAGNVLGGGDWGRDRIVPDCIRALREERPIMLRCPEAIRPWQHVLEPVYGYLLLGLALAGRPGEFSAAWNLGPDRESVVTVGELVETLLREWGSGSWKAQGRDGLHEATLLHLNIDKAREVLGWTPVWNLEETVRRTVEWYRSLLDGKEMRGVVEEQIDRYTEEAAHGG